MSTEFENDGEVLQELHHWWLRVLLARLHSLELLGCPHKVYDELAAAHRGLRLLLDAHSGHPALAAGMRRERDLLGAMAA